MMHWIIGAVVAAMVVVGGGLYVMNSGSLSMEGGVNVATGDVTGDGSDDAVEKEADAVADKATPKLIEKASAFTGSFFDLATRGGNYKCDVQSAGVNQGTTGTVFVSDTNLRGDFTITANGKSLESHMLKIADKTYVWSSFMPQGVIMQSSEVQNPGGGAVDASNPTQSYAWDCIATGIDARMFAVPADVQFKDMTTMMQGSGSVPGAR